jgi:predicted secreted hydrolase
LENGAELMLYRLRRKDGTTDSHSAGTYIDSRGRSRHLSLEDIVMQPQGDLWFSPNTGARYPLRWNISVPSLRIDLVCTTPFRDQEVVSQRGASPNYWEGAVD